jgi:hypothetical protein
MKAVSPSSTSIRDRHNRVAHQEAVARREAGESLVDIGRSYNVSHSTISRL